MPLLNLLSDAGESFVKLFTEMNAVTAILFVLGIIFCAIEMVTPGFGIFGFGGIAMIVVGIVLRLCSGGDLWMLLYMILIAMALFVVMFVVASRLITKGRLSKTALFSVKPAVSEDKTAGTEDFSYLLGKEGVAHTGLRPVGKAYFDGTVVDVVARDGFIDEGTHVVCVLVEGQRVVVVEKEETSS